MVFFRVLCYFQHLKKKIGVKKIISGGGGWVSKCLNGRWLLQIVDRDSGNLYPIQSSIPLFWFFISNMSNVGVVWGGGGGGNIFLAFYAISNISRKK